MINFKNITQAIETILNAQLSDYKIVRNELRNVDPNQATWGKGWIGIYRGKLDYEPHTTGATPWLVSADVIIEIQVASMTSGDDAEDKLQDAEQEVLNALVTDLTLGGTVLMTNGFSIEYDYNEDEQVYYHAAVITVRGELRA